MDETTRQLIEVGIARRMLTGSGQHHLPNDPKGCSFWVEVETDPYDDVEITAVIVQFPPNGHTQAFEAMPGKSFGTAKHPPLSVHQQELVDRLAEEWKASQGQG